MPAAGQIGDRLDEGLPRDALVDRAAVGTDIIGQARERSPRSADRRERPRLSARNASRAPRVTASERKPRSRLPAPREEPIRAAPRVGAARRRPNIMRDGAAEARAIVVRPIPQSARSCCAPQRSASAIADGGIGGRAAAPAGPAGADRPAARRPGRLRPAQVPPSPSLPSQLGTSGVPPALAAEGA